MTQVIRVEESKSSDRMLYMALELSSSRWHVAFSDGKKPRRVSVEARDLSALLAELARAKQHFGLAPDCRVLSCYEAGRDGFWLHRALAARGIESLVVGSSSVAVDRRLRRPKTDRIDLDKLMSMLLRHAGGEPGVWRVVSVPSPAAEDARRASRELDKLKQERLRHTNRIQSLLMAQGMRCPLGRDFVAALPKLRNPDGQALGPQLQAELLRQYRRLQLVLEQIRELEAARRAALRAAEDPGYAMAARLARLKGIGETGSVSLVQEYFGWRAFGDRRRAAGLIGLTPTPYSSGSSRRELGISKAGNPRQRALLTQLGWGWLRHQPNSALSRWYEERFGNGGKRLRRIGIIALARRLFIALWRYLEHGEIPEGAELKR